MSNIVNIAFQGGTHGNYLRFCIDKFSTLTADIQGTPFTENKTSHKSLNYSGAINRYHPNTEEPFFKHTDESHILITIDKEDVMYICTTTSTTIMQTYYHSSKVAKIILFSFVFSFEIYAQSSSISDAKVLFKEWIATEKLQSKESSDWSCCCRPY